MDAVAAALAAAVADAKPVFLKGPVIVPGSYVLVDGDYLIYSTSGNNETSIGDARMRLMQKLQDFKTMSGAEHLILHLTATGGHKGHRYIIGKIKPYQGNRSGSTRPKNWELLRDYCESYSGLAFRQKLWGTREADDGIALHVRMLHEKGTPVTVVMKDKDSQMFTGCRHMDWDTFEITDVPRDTFAVENSVGRLFGSKWFWMQMLMGDSADNIPGVQMIRGVTKMVQCGKSRASDALIMCGDDLDCANKVVTAYRAQYKEQWAAAFVENAALLWMRDDVNAEIDDFLRIVPKMCWGYDEIAVAADELIGRVREVINATPD